MKTGISTKKNLSLWNSPSPVMRSTSTRIQNRRSSNAASKETEQSGGIQYHELDSLLNDCTTALDALSWCNSQGEVPREESQECSPDTQESLTEFVHRPQLGNLLSSSELSLDGTHSDRGRGISDITNLRDNRFPSFLESWTLRKQEASVDSFGQKVDDTIQSHPGQEESSIFPRYEERRILEWNVERPADYFMQDQHTPFGGPTKKLKFTQASADVGTTDVTLSQGQKVAHRFTREAIMLLTEHRFYSDMRSIARTSRIRTRGQEAVDTYLRKRKREE